MLMITYLIMGYCLPTITVMLFVDWWNHRRLMESTEES